MRYQNFVFVLLGFALSCSTSITEQEAAIFRYNEASGISSLDPAFARAQNNIWAVHQLFNTLVEFDASMNIKPSLADTFWMQNEGLEYVFRIRNGVYFHPHPSFLDYPIDAELKASDVVYSINRLRSKELASSGAWTMEALDSIYVEGDRVIFKLKEAFPPFLSILTMKYCSILSEKVAKTMGHNYSLNPIGTGPFYLKLWAQNEKMVLRRHEQYFEKDESGAALPYLDAINIKFISDRQSAFLELRNGNLDFLSGLDPSYKDEILSPTGELREKYQSDYNLIKAPYLNLEYLAFNLHKLQNEKSPYAELYVRRAMNYAIDRPKMLEFLRSGLGYPAHHGVVPPALYSEGIEINGFEKNDSLALYYLEEAGYTKGAGLPTLILNTNPSYVDLCEFLQNQWNQLGIPVKINVMQASPLRESISSGKLDFFRASWIADYPDPENYLFLFLTIKQPPFGPNYSFFSDTDFDALYEKALQSEASEAQNIYAEADSLVIHNAPIIPLFYDMSVRLVSKKVEGMESNPMNLLELRNVGKK